MSQRKNNDVFFFGVLFCLCPIPREGWRFQTKKKIRVQKGMFPTQNECGKKK